MVESSWTGSASRLDGRGGRCWGRTSWGVNCSHKIEPSQLLKYRARYERYAGAGNRSDARKSEIRTRKICKSLRTLRITRVIRGLRTAKAREKTSQTSVRTL